VKSGNLIAKAQITINAPADKVWDALINPDAIKKYMFGTTVISNWKEGSKIVWRGEWKGKTYEDKGVILQLKSKTKLQYSHFSPLTGQPDVPENYHTVTIELTEKNGQTTVFLSQDNNATQEAKEHSEQNWTEMLSRLKKFLEKS
jgi:uncharacterized protein YndB with AHSA1/START domain